MEGERDENASEKFSQISNTPNIMISIDGNEVIIIGDKMTRMPLNLLGVRNGFNTNWIQQQQMLLQNNIKRNNDNQLKQTKNNMENNKMNQETLKNNRDKFLLTSRFQRTAYPSYRMKNVDSNFAPSQNKLPLNVNFNQENSIPNQYPTNNNNNNNFRTENFDFNNRKNQNNNFDNSKISNIDFYNREYENLPNKNQRIENFESSRNFRDFPKSLDENIFEPRPQIIQYLFSAPRENVFEAKKSNFINDDAQIDSVVIKEPGIASIEVSEEPRHKIRHHHGERLRRNYSRQ